MKILQKDIEDILLKNANVIKCDSFKEETRELLFECFNSITRFEDNKIIGEGEDKKENKIVIFLYFYVRKIRFHIEDSSLFYIGSRNNNMINETTQYIIEDYCNRIIDLIKELEIISLTK